jgi:flavin reductase (DIM6/NTAB) family NADH-FMN oxidoreductase RutF
MLTRDPVTTHAAQGLGQASEGDPGIDAEPFRRLLGRFATGVAVITARRIDGRPAGMTANSLASVSLCPPLVSVCVESRCAMHETLADAEDFALNILSAEQEEISRRFASRGVDRFDLTPWHATDSGLIVLDGALAYLECRCRTQVSAGDHTIFIGQVVGGRMGQGRPLLFYEGVYTRLTDAHGVQRGSCDTP